MWKNHIIRLYVIIIIRKIISSNYLMDLDKYKIKIYLYIFDYYLFIK